MPGEYYYFVYLLIISVITIYQCNYYSKQNRNALEHQGISNTIPSFILALSLTLFIGLRPDWYGFTDSRNYIRTFEFIENEVFYFNSETDNIIFDNLLTWMACNNMGWSIFFLTIASIYFFGMWTACRKMFPANTTIAFLVCLAAFSTFSYATNGIKAGAAVSIFLIAIAYRNNLKVALPSLALSLGFHHSMTMPIAAFALAYVYKNTKIYFSGWVFCLAMAVLHVTFFQQLFAGFTDEQGSNYLLSSGTDWGGKEGFRLDFVLYSAMPVLIGYIAIYKKKIRSVFYEFILSIYLITNGIWMLCMYANFTNRIAYLSWSIYPIVLIYPLINENWGKSKYKTMVKVIYLHLLFTIFCALYF